MKDGMLLIRGIGQPLKSSTARLELSRQRLSIVDGRGTLGSGSMSLSGVYNLDPRKPGLSLQMNLNRANLVVMDDVPTEVTGMVSLKGEDAPYNLSGRVQVSNAIYSKEFQSDSAIVPAAADPVLRFGLDVELGSNVHVKNSLTSSLLNGRLFIGGTDIDPNVQGVVSIQTGSIFANESEFKVSQGNVNFPGGTAPPYVGLQASTVVKYNAQDYKIDLRARGPVDRLDIEFTSDPALSTPDILNLLAFGVLNDTDDSSSTANTDVVNAARMEAFQALFGKAIGNGLDKSTGVQLRFRAAQDLSQKELVPKITLMRKVTDRVSVTFGQSLNNADRDVQLDYKLLNNVNLTGVWEIQQNGLSQKEDAFGADLRFRFDVK
jgi:autotransporter translocation and assembly factor TamB